MLKISKFKVSLLIAGHLYPIVCCNGVRYVLHAYCVPQRDVHSVDCFAIELFLLSCHSVEL